MSAEEQVGGEFVACPLCGADNGDVVASTYSREPWVIRDCPGCGFVYLANPPAYERLEEEFAWEKTSAKVTAGKKESAPARVMASEATKKLRRNLLKRTKIRDLAVAKMPYPPRTLVDIGCAKGNTVAGLAEELAGAGYEPKPVGIEISAELAKKATKKLKKMGGKCIASDALSGLKTIPSGSVSLILMSAYLEHECRPAEVLEESARCLQAGGVVVLKVPNYGCWNRRVMGARWCGFRHPDHVNYFTPGTLRRMAENAGLKRVRGGMFDVFPTSDNMYAVLVKEAR